MRRYLVVGNQSLGSDELLAELLRRANSGPSCFHVVVPMSHPVGAWSAGSAHSAAQSRLTAALERFMGLGLDVTGEVGDASPVVAVSDALLRYPDVDAIIVSTFRRGASVWLSNNVLRRIAREHPYIPLSHVVPAPQPVG